MQTLIIAGNVGKDPVLRTTQNGDKVLGFSVAVNNGKDSNGNDRPPTWFDCSIWGKRAEALAPHIHKGDKLTLSGRPTSRAHEGKAYLGLSVNDLTFMGGGNRDSKYDAGDSGGYSPQGSDGGYSRDMDDEIPF